MVTKDMRLPSNIPWWAATTSQVSSKRLPSIDRMEWEMALTPIRQAWIKISEIPNSHSTRLIRLMEVIENFHSNNIGTCKVKISFQAIKWLTLALIILMAANEMQDPLAATMDIPWAKSLTMPLTLLRLSYGSTAKNNPIKLELFPSQKWVRPTC